MPAMVDIFFYRRVGQRQGALALSRLSRYGSFRLAYIAAWLVTVVTKRAFMNQRCVVINYQWDINDDAVSEASGLHVNCITASRYPKVA